MPPNPSGPVRVTASARPSLDEMADAWEASNPPEPERPSLEQMADEWESTRATDLSAAADAWEESRKAAQLARGLSEPLDVPTDADLYGRADALWHTTYDRVKLRGQSDADASAEAWATVNATMRSPSKSDAGKMTLPAIDAGVSKLATAVGGTAGDVIAAVGPRTFTERGVVPQFVTPRTDPDRAMAREVRAAELHNLGGMTWDEAKRQAATEADRGLLLMENPESRATPTAKATELAFETAPVAPSALAGAADVARGGAALAQDVVGAIKTIGVDAPLAIGEAAVRPLAEAVGVTGGPDTMKAIREAEVPSPFDYIAERALPGWARGTWLEPVHAEAQASKARGGGLTTGWAGLFNAQPAVEAGLFSSIDPAGDGAVDRLAWYMASTGLNQDAPPDPSGTDLAEQSVLGVGKALGRMVDVRGDLARVEAEGVRGAVEAAADRSATTAEALTTPAMQALGIVTMPEGRETTVGQTMRVAGSALAGLATTYGARAVDYWLTRAGATSYRTGRTRDPELNTPASFWQAAAGPLTAGYWQDYAATLSNGDGVTTEVMRAMDTVARGMPDLSAETRAYLMPGSRVYDTIVQFGMMGDLLLPLDKVPGAALSNTAGRGARFARGVLAATDAGVGWRDALPVGAAQAVPTLTAWALRNDPTFRAGMDAFTAEKDAQATQAASDVAQRPARVVSDETDATAVTVAMLYRYARREGERGRSFGELVNAVVPYGQMAVADQMREVYTRLGVERPPERPVEPEARGLRQQTADTLRRMGYADTDLAGMDDAEGRLRIDEQIRPGDDPSAVPDSPVPRQDVRDGLRRLRAVAEDDDTPPIGQWPEAVTRETDPDTRAGAALAALAQHMGVAADSAWPRLALQVALSFYDPVSGRYVRSEFPTDAVLDAVSGPHLTTALNRLRQAKPASIWKAAQAFELGGTPWLPNDVRLEAEVARRTRAAEGPTRWAGSGSLAAALGIKGAEGPTTPAQRVATTAAAWVDRAGEVVTMRRRDLREALGYAQKVWADTATATNADPLLPPEVSMVDALVAASGVDPRLATRIARAVEAVRAAEARLARSEATHAAMVAYADAVLDANRPATTGSAPRKIPARARVRAELRKLAAAGQVAFTAEQVDLYLTVWDRVAEALAKRGVVKTPDGWWGLLEFGTNPTPGSAGTAAVVMEGARVVQGVVSLAEKADLSVLFHESAHVLRRMLPPEMMADVDSFVRREFGGWTERAEEWFAEQFEWVMSTGTLRLPVGDPLRASPRIGALNRALRLAAGVLASVLNRVQGELRAAGMTYSPVMERWVADFLDLSAGRKVPQDVVRKGTGPALAAVELPPEPTLRSRAQRRAAAAAALREATAAVEPLAPRFKAAVDDALAGRAPALPPEIPPPPPRETVRATPPPTTHHASFTTTARRAFMAEVSKLGYRYDEVAEWTERAGRGRPSAWTPEERAALVRDLARPEVRAAIEGTRAQVPLTVPTPEPEPGRDLAAEMRARDVLERLVQDAADALTKEVAGRNNPSAVKAAKRRFIEALGAQILRDRGEAIPTDGAALRSVVPVEVQAAVEDALTQGRKLTPEARVSLLEPVLDAAADRLLPMREAPATRMVDALVPDATPAPVVPTPESSAADARPPMGPVGSTVFTPAGLPRTMYDSENLPYGFRIAVLPMDAVMASHTDALGVTEGYPQELQPRTDAWRREDRIEAQASNLTPGMISAEDSVPTAGAPCVWLNAAGQNVVAAGNGRYIAIARALRRNGAVAAGYRAFVQGTARAYGLPEPGPFDVVVRVLDIPPEDTARAVVFAQNSQESGAAPMTLTEEINGITTKVRALGRPVAVTAAEIPVRVDATTAYQLLIENPELNATLREVLDPATYDDLLKKRDADFVKQVKGVLLAALDPGTVASLRGAGMLDVAADAVPALGALSALTREIPAWADADVAAVLGDAADLLARARGQDLASPKAMAKVVEELTRQVGMMTNRPIPVSRVSLAVAMALHADPDGFGRRIGEVADALRSSRQTSMFAAQVVDPAQIVVDAMVPKSRQAAMPTEIPVEHAAAVRRANDLQAAAIEAKEARAQVDDPLPLDPNKPLNARRVNVDAVTGAVGAGGPLQRGVLRDEPVRGLAATANLEEGKDPIGLLYRLGRSLPDLDRPGLNAALGYAPDTRVYDARDLQARVFAYVVGGRIQSAQGRSWVRRGLVTAVPRDRLAAVSRRVDAVLGTLPAAILAAQQANATGGRTGLSLSPDVAARVKLLVDYLKASGNADALHPRSLLTRSAVDFTTTLTLWEWEALVRATHDAVSGVLPYRGRVESYGLAASMLWSLTQRYGGLLVPEPTTRGASVARRSLNALRRRAGSLVLAVGSFFLPYEDFQPQMAEYVRPRYRRVVREIGSEPAAVMDRLERALSTAARSPSAVADALRGLQAEPAFEPIVSVARQDGPSDLDRLRGWLYRDAVPDPSGRKHGRPYPGLVGLLDANNGQRVRHDLPLDPGDVPTVADLYAQADLVERVLFRAEGMTGDTMAAIDALRSRSLDAESSALLVMMLYDKLNACAARGLEVLQSAAGKSGTDKVADTVAKMPGMALDAYEAFYQGRFDRPIDGNPATPGNAVYVDGARVVDTSLPRLVEELSVGKAIPTHLWLTETVIRFNVRRIVDRFVSDLVEMQYVRDLRGYFKDAHPDAPPPSLLTATAFGQRIVNGARDILLGRDQDLQAGVTARGVTVPGVRGTSGLTEGERYAAKLLLSRLGILSELPTERKGIKGNVAPTPTLDLFGGSANAQNLAALLADPAKMAEARTQPFSWDGQDVVLPDTLAQHLFHAVERHAPLGRYLGEALADRSRVNGVLGTLREYVRLLKGTLITGGPNAWPATVMALGALAGGATPASVAAVGVAAGALSFVPRLPGYINNATGALFQVFMLGPRALATTLGSPKVAGMASKVTAETVTFRRWGGAMRHAEAVLEGLATRAVGNLDAVAFTTPDGRIYTLGMVADISREYGLDGTQARFEAEEVTDARLTRLYEQYQDTTYMGRLWGLIKSFYGRNVIAENYRKVYESVDAYVRHAVLIRGLMDGLTPEDAVNRALLVTFDYSQVSPLDRAFNAFFLFWMYTRRSIDLTLYTLLTNPQRVLGPMRWMRMQDHTASYADLNDEGEAQSEPVPDYAQGSPAVVVLPLAGANNRAVKIVTTEPPQTLAFRTMWEILGGDIPALVGKANPVVQTGANGVLLTTTGQWVDFFKRRDVASDPRMNEVPSWLVRLDQALGGGSIGQALGISPHEETDPQRRAQVGDPITWQVVDHPVAWQAARQLVPGASTVLYQQDLADRGDRLSDRSLTAVYAFLDGVDPANLAGLRDVSTPEQPAFRATNAQPRVGIGPVWEAARSFGLRPMIVQTPWAARTAPKRATSARINAAQGAADTYAPFAPVPDAARLPVRQVKPSQGLGVEPDKEIGIEKR